MRHSVHLSASGRCVDLSAGGDAYDDAIMAMHWRMLRSMYDGACVGLMGGACPAAVPLWLWHYLVASYAAVLNDCWWVYADLRAWQEKAAHTCITNCTAF